ncbi:phage tail protein [Pedobacter sp. ASV12]|uniref:phage tail protein n=1 Tax=Pedobacter sp. ASV12 TaxID=2795120 RepID=UPI0018EB2730|nr:phage tail protein [Pedobacter sp. ASV12]
MESNYPLSFYFKLSFKDEDAAFKEVSGIAKELGIEEVASGGENRFKYKLPTVATGQNLVLRRAMIPSGSKLIDWCASTLDEGLHKQVETNDVSVSLLAADGKVSKMWTFHKAYPVKYNVSDLKSMENELLIESIELAYTYFNVSAAK